MAKKHLYVSNSEIAITKPTKDRNDIDFELQNITSRALRVEGYVILLEPVVQSTLWKYNIFLPMLT